MDNASLQETKVHGTPAFPYSVYQGRIPAWIPSFPLHWHESFEIIYCDGGSLQATLWGRAYRLGAGDLLVVLPQAVHSIEQAGTAQGEYYNIMFGPSLFQGGRGDPCYDKYVLPFVKGQRQMEGFHPAGSAFTQAAMPWVRSLLTHRQESLAEGELLVKSSLFQLLHIMVQHSLPTEGSQPPLRLAYGRLKNALCCIQNSCQQEISIREAASQCGFSESYFMKLFKDLTGKSFHAYLVDYRLEMAAQQLAETSYRVIDVAENAGFHNHSYFTRAFQKKYQMTPLAYRKAARAGGEQGTGAGCMG